MRWMLVVAFVLLSGQLSAGDKSIIVVFNIDAKRIAMSKDLREVLSDYLATKLAGTGRFQVVPRDQLKKRLLQQKKKSYKQCYDQSCQIEMGRELAAEKTIAAQVSKIGSICAVSITLYDLKKAAAEAAASENGKCGEDELLASIDKAVAKLTGDASVINLPVGEKEAVTSPEEARAGIKWIYSKPAEIDFARSETTVSQFRVCVEAGKCSKPVLMGEEKSCNWVHPDRDNHPVNCVNWHQAKAFCEWAGGRLPTADEWVAEASNGGRRKYPWGDAEASCKFTIMSQDGKGCGRNSTWPVCSKPGGNSVSSLCDMGGNLTEWSSSMDKVFKKSPKVRGGFWYAESPGTFANSYPGTSVDPIGQYDWLGFRCVRMSQ